MEIDLLMLHYHKMPPNDATAFRKVLAENDLVNQKRWSWCHAVTCSGGAPEMKSVFFFYLLAQVGSYLILRIMLMISLEGWIFPGV